MEEENSTRRKELFELIKASTDIKERSAAIKELGELGGPESVELLLNLLAPKQLREAQKKETVPMTGHGCKIISPLKTTSKITKALPIPSTSRYAVTPPGMYDSMIAGMRRDIRMARAGYEASISAALELIGAPAIPKLLEALQKEGTASVAAMTLSKAGLDRKQATEVLSLIQETKSLFIRRQAISLLVDVRDYRVVPVLMGSLKAYPDSTEATQLRTLLRRAQNLEEVSAFEDHFNKRINSMKKGKKSRTYLELHSKFFMKLRNEITGRKNELAGKKDILLPEKPKPPPRGKVFRMLKYNLNC